MLAPQLVLSPAAQGQNARSYPVSSLRRAAAHAGRCRRAAARAVSFRGRNRGGQTRVRSSTSRRRRELWARALHGFAWLPPLAMAGGEPARALATNLIAQWVKRNGALFRTRLAAGDHGAPPVAHFRAWPLRDRRIPICCGVRSCSFRCASNRDRSRALRRARPTDCHASKRPPSARCPVRVSTTASAGLQTGLDRLDAEIAQQILPDGGHVSRSPEALFMPIATW